MVQNQPQNSPKQWKKDGEASVKDKLKGWVLYLLKGRQHLSNKTKPNDLQELQESFKQPQLKVEPLSSRMNKLKFDVCKPSSTNAQEREKPREWF